MTTVYVVGWVDPDSRVLDLEVWTREEWADKRAREILDENLDAGVGGHPLRQAVDLDEGAS